MATEPSEELITVQEFANRYLVDVSVVRRWVKEKRIRFQLVGPRHLKRIRPSEVLIPIPTKIYPPLNTVFSEPMEAGKDNGRQSTDGPPRGGEAEGAGSNSLGAGRPEEKSEGPGRGGSTPRNPGKPSGRGGGAGNHHHRR